MLYSAFLDKDIRSQLSEYAALAVIPSWDDTAAAAAATDLSVDTLYGLAFTQHGPEGKFWVKTLTLEDPKKLSGGDGGSRAGGHAAIYNNDDLELVDFVRATSKLQQGAPAGRTFHEALSSTLTEPRYEELAPMFVTAVLVSSVAEVG